MKKLYFFFLLSILTTTVSAQQYVPMLDSVNEWSYTGLVFGVRLSQSTQSTPCNYPTNNMGPSFKEYTTTDTVINSFTYKTVMQSSASCALGYIREDTAARKVYFISNNDTAEKVLYDFSMQVGDTMTFNFFYPNNGYVNGLYTLDSITNVQIHAGTRRAFWFACHSAAGSRIFSWVESVGNQNDLLYPYFDNNLSTWNWYTNCPGVQHDFAQFLICFDHQAKVYFDSCAFSDIQNNACCAVITDTCDYFTFIGGINELSSHTSFDLFPNPSSGITTLNLDVKQKSDFKIVVWDVNGKNILKEIPLGQIEQGNKTIDLDFSSFSNGIYIVELKTTEGSVYNKLLIAK